MSKKRVYYKVVRTVVDANSKHSDVLFFSAWTTNPQFRLFYPTCPGRVVEKVKGTIGITVFKSLPSAERFADHMKHTSAIIKVVGVGSPRTPKVMPVSKDIVAFYAKKKGVEWKRNKIPVGTVCFDKVVIA